MSQSYWKHYINRLPAPLRNKYIVTGLVFTISIMFLVRFSIVDQLKLRRTYNELQEKIEHYEEEKKRDQAEFDAIFSDKKVLEKVARERYYMKRDNEDVFYIPDVEKKSDKQK